MKKLLTTTLLLLALPSAHALDIQRWRTAEGTTVLLVERHENPIVDISVQFPAAGSIADPQGKNGLADFAAGLLTTGTKKHDEENFNKVNSVIMYSNVYTTNAINGINDACKEAAKRYESISGYNQMNIVDKTRKLLDVSQ